VGGYECHIRRNFCHTTQWAVALEEELLLLVFVVNDETSNLIMLRLVGFTKVVFERLSVEWNDRSLSL